MTNQRVADCLRWNSALGRWLSLPIARALDDLIWLKTKKRRAGDLASTRRADRARTWGRTLVHGGGPRLDRRAI